MKSSSNLSKIMNMAWEMARAGAGRFGGKPRTYFACSLALAWKEEKQMRHTAKSGGKTQSMCHPGLGNQYILPGIPLPKSPVRKGQIFLPGLGL